MWEQMDIANDYLFSPVKRVLRTLQLKSFKYAHYDPQTDTVRLNVEKINRLLATDIDPFAEYEQGHRQKQPPGSTQRLHEDSGFTLKKGESRVRLVSGDIKVSGIGALMRGVAQRSISVSSVDLVLEVVYDETQAAAAHAGEGGQAERQPLASSLDEHAIDHDGEYREESSKPSDWGTSNEIKEHEAWQDNSEFDVWSSWTGTSGDTESNTASSPLQPPPPPRSLTSSFDTVSGLIRFLKDKIQGSTFSASQVTVTLRIPPSGEATASATVSPTISSLTKTKEDALRVGTVVARLECAAGLYGVLKHTESESGNWDASFGLRDCKVFVHTVGVDDMAAPLGYCHTDSVFNSLADLLVATSTSAPSSSPPSTSSPSTTRQPADKGEGSTTSSHKESSGMPTLSSYTHLVDVSFTEEGEGEEEDAGVKAASAATLVSGGEGARNRARSSVSRGILRATRLYVTAHLAQWSMICTPERVALLARLVDTFIGPPSSLSSPPSDSTEEAVKLNVGSDEAIEEQRRDKRTSEDRSSEQGLLADAKDQPEGVTATQAEEAAVQALEEVLLEAARMQNVKRFFQICCEGASLTLVTATKTSSAVVEEAWRRVLHEGQRQPTLDATRDMVLEVPHVSFLVQGVDFLFPFIDRAKAFMTDTKARVYRRLFTRRRADAEMTARMEEHGGRVVFFGVESVKVMEQRHANDNAAYVVLEAESQPYAMLLLLRVSCPVPRPASEEGSRSPFSQAQHGQRYDVFVETVCETLAHVKLQLDPGLLQAACQYVQCVSGIIVADAAPGPRTAAAVLSGGVSGKASPLPKTPAGTKVRGGAEDSVLRSRSIGKVLVHRISCTVRYPDHDASRRQSKNASQRKQQGDALSPSSSPSSSSMISYLPDTLAVHVEDLQAVQDLDAPLSILWRKIAVALDSSVEARSTELVCIADKNDEVEVLVYRADLTSPGPETAPGTVRDMLLRDAFGLGDSYIDGIGGLHAGPEVQHHAARDCLCIEVHLGDVETHPITQSDYVRAQYFVNELISSLFNCRHSTSPTANFTNDEAEEEDEEGVYDEAHNAANARRLFTSQNAKRQSIWTALDAKSTLLDVHVQRLRVTLLTPRLSPQGTALGMPHCIPRSRLDTVDTRLLFHRYTAEVTGLSVSSVACDASDSVGSVSEVSVSAAGLFFVETVALLPHREQAELVNDVVLVRSYTERPQGATLATAAALLESYDRGRLFSSYLRRTTSVGGGDNSLSERQQQQQNIFHSHRGGGNVSSDGIPSEPNGSGSTCVCEIRLSSLSTRAEFPASAAPAAVAAATTTTTTLRSRWTRQHNITISLRCLCVHHLPSFLGDSWLATMQNFFAGADVAEMLARLSGTWSSFSSFSTGTKDDSTRGKAAAQAPPLLSKAGDSLSSSRNSPRVKSLTHTTATITVSNVLWAYRPQGVGTSLLAALAPDLSCTVVCSDERLQPLMSAQCYVVRPASVYLCSDCEVSALTDGVLNRSAGGWGADMEEAGFVRLLDVTSTLITTTTAIVPLSYSSSVSRAGCDGVGKASAGRANVRISINRALHATKPLYIEVHGLHAAFFAARDSAFALADVTTALVQLTDLRYVEPPEELVRRSCGALFWWVPEEVVRRSAPLTCRVNPCLSPPSAACGGGGGATDVGVGGASDAATTSDCRVGISCATSTTIEVFAFSRSFGAYQARAVSLLGGHQGTWAAELKRKRMTSAAAANHGGVNRGETGAAKEEAISEWVREVQGTTAHTDAVAMDSAAFSASLSSVSTASFEALENMYVQWHVNAAYVNSLAPSSSSAAGVAGLDVVAKVKASSAIRSSSSSSSSCSDVSERDYIDAYEESGDDEEESRGEDSDNEDMRVLLQDSATARDSGKRTATTMPAEELEGNGVAFDLTALCERSPHFMSCLHRHPRRREIADDLHARGCDADLFYTSDNRGVDGRSARHVYPPIQLELLVIDCGADVSLYAGADLLSAAQREQQRCYNQVMGRMCTRANHGVYPSRYSDFINRPGVDTTTASAGTKDGATANKQREEQQPSVSQAVLRELHDRGLRTGFGVRSASERLVARFRGIGLQLDTFVFGCEEQRRIRLTVQEGTVYDCLAGSGVRRLVVATAPRPREWMRCAQFLSLTWVTLVPRHAAALPQLAGLRVAPGSATTAFAGLRVGNPEELVKVRLQPLSITWCGVSLDFLLEFFATGGGNDGETMQPGLSSAAAPLSAAAFSRDGLLSHDGCAVGGDEEDDERPPFDPHFPPPLFFRRFIVCATVITMSGSFDSDYGVLSALSEGRRLDALRSLPLMSLLSLNNLQVPLPHIHIEGCSTPVLVRRLLEDGNCISFRFFLTLCCCVVQPLSAAAKVGDAAKSLVLVPMSQYRGPALTHALTRAAAQLAEEMVSQSASVASMFTHGTYRASSALYRALLGEPAAASLVRSGTASAGGALQPADATEGTRQAVQYIRECVQNAYVLSSSAQRGGSGGDGGGAAGAVADTLLRVPAAGLLVLMGISGAATSILRGVHNRHDITELQREARVYRSGERRNTDLGRGEFDYL